MLSKKLFTSTAIYTIGGGLPVLASLILLPFYTDAFTPAQFGQLSLLIGLTLFFYQIVNVAMDSYISVHYHFRADDKKSLEALLSTVFIFQLIAGAIFLLIMIFLGEFIFSVFFGGDHIDFFWTGFYCVVTAITTSTLKIFQQIQIQRRQPGRYFAVSIISSTLLVVLSLLGLYFLPSDIDGPLYGRMVAGLLLLVWIVIKIKPNNYDVKGMSGWMSFCWPLMAMGILGWAISYMGPFILSRYSDGTEIGLYTLVLTLLMGVEFFQNGLSTAINPILFEMRVRKNEISSEESGYHHLFSMASIWIIGLSILVLPILVELLVHKQEYHQALQWLPLYAIAYVWKGPYNIGYSIAIYQRKSLLLMRNSLLSVVLQLFVVAILSMLYGINGALIGTVIGRAVQGITLYYFTRSGQLVRPNPIKIFVTPIIFSTALAIVFVNPWNGSPLTNGLICTLFVSLLCVVIYRKEMPRAIELGRRLIGL